MFHLPHGKPRRALLRSASALVGVLALVALGSANPVQASVSAASATTPTAVNVCNQAVKPGFAACLALKRTDKIPNTGMAISPNALPSGYGRTDLLSAYALPSSGGSGQTVAIVDAQDDPNAESDLATYRSTYGLPACTTANGCFKKINQNGGTSYPTADTGWAGEISLDVDMVSAVCPSCHILLVEATSANMSDLGTAVNQAVAQGAKFVSNSYGGSEDGSEASSDSSYFHHPGVAITASSGDGAYSAGTSYPASAPVRDRGRRHLAEQEQQHPRLDRVGVEDHLLRGRRLRLLLGRDQADLAARHRLHQAHGLRRVRGRRPGHRRRGLPDLRRLGWAVYGGTSASSPIIASVYALAGTPGARTPRRRTPTPTPATCST